MEALVALEPTAGRQAVDKWARAKVNLLTLQNYAREAVPLPPSSSHATAQEWTAWLHQSEAATMYATVHVKRAALMFHCSSHHVLFCLI